jgi:hypothetical protein
VQSCCYGGLVGYDAALTRLRSLCRSDEKGDPSLFEINQKIMRIEPKKKRSRSTTGRIVSYAK